MISVDKLINESKPELVQRWPKLSQLLIKALQWAVREDEFQAFQRQYPAVEGVAFADKVIDYVGFSYRVADQYLQKIPDYGAVVIVANHPIGSLDGLALISMVAKIRPDVKILANEMLSQLEPLAPVMVPVKVWGSSKRKQLEEAKLHLRNGSPLIVFPSGKVSRFGKRGIEDGNWKSGFLRLAQANRTPILPIHVSGRNSLFFYVISMLAPLMSTLWLVRELFKHRDNCIEFTVGDPVSYSSYAAEQLTADQISQRFKYHTYLVGEKKPGVFRTDQPIAAPEDRQQLRQDIRACSFLGTTPDNMGVYLCRYRDDCSVIRELGRLREMSFRAGSEGTGKSRDLDSFDQHYHQLILWDDQHSEMVGGYRLHEGVSGETDSVDYLYSSRLFRLESNFLNYRKQGLELGRSFVQPKYWGRRSLDYLWYALGAYLKQNPQIRYLFGPVTIPATYPVEARELLVHFYSTHFPPSGELINAKNPYQISADRKRELNNLFPGKNYKQEFVELKKRIAKMGMSIPTLFKQYTEACEEGGVEFLAFHNGSGIGDGITGFIIVDTAKMTASKRSRYIGA